MRHRRIYHDAPLINETTLELSLSASHHIMHVLRLRKNDHITIFNGHNEEATCLIRAIEKKTVCVHVIDCITKNIESPLHIHLYQGLIRPEKMDFILQKATELGVSAITPVRFARCQYQLDAKRQEKKQAHFEKVIINACEQCGRNVLPIIHAPLCVDALPQADQKMVMAFADPTQKNALNSIDQNRSVPITHIGLLIGPEGGFTKQEIDYFITHGVKSFTLGPRILRAETAALTSIALAQTYFGDL